MRAGYGVAGAGETEFAGVKGAEGGCAEATSEGSVVFFEEGTFECCEEGRGCVSFGMTGHLVMSVSSPVVLRCRLRADLKFEYIPYSVLIETAQLQTTDTEKQSGCLTKWIRLHSLVNRRTMHIQEQYFANWFYCKIVRICMIRSEG
jgi:hypothetical protein